MPIKNDLKNHFDESLKINPGPTPLFKMWLAAIVITLPLCIGLLRQEALFSMFGSLMGLVYYLNDHFGSVKKRIQHLTATFVCLMISLIIGCTLTNQFLLIAIILFILSFLVGKSKEFGLELERLMLFITLQFLTASSDPIVKDSLIPFLIYSLLAFIIYLLTLIILQVLLKHPINPIKSKRTIITHILKTHESNYFSLVCAVLTTSSYLFSHLLKFSHAQWIVGTALIVILPNRKMGIYKSFQRILGTVAGVILSAFFISFFQDPKILIFMVFCTSFFLPMGLSKNYWIGNVAIAALILFFLEFASPQSIEGHHLAYWRIVDITIGSIVGVIAALFLSDSSKQNA